MQSEGKITESGSFASDEKLGLSFFLEEFGILLYIRFFSEVL